MLFYNGLNPKLEEYILFEEMFNAVYSIFIFYHIIKLVFFDKEALSKISSYDDISWVKVILKFGAVVMIMWIFAVIYYYFTREAWIYDPLKIVYSILVYWLGYQGLISAKVADDRIFLRKEIQGKNAFQNMNLIGNKSSHQLGQKHQQEFKSIKNYVIGNKRYLDPLFSLEKLCNEMDFSNSHASKIINSYSSYNFSDFINSLRIDYAKQLLANQEFSKYTVVSIGLESGFNSKSTFYSAFNKFENKTPTEYRKINIK